MRLIRTNYGHVSLKERLWLTCCSRTQRAPYTIQPAINEDKVKHEDWNKEVAHGYTLSGCSTTAPRKRSLTTRERK